MIRKMDSSPIRLRNCSKTYGDGTIAVGPVDIEIAAGETVVILGPSGCGKTTTLRMMAGLEMPDPGGHVLFGADDVTRLPIEKRNVGMVFQSYALFPNLDVLENIAYGLRVRGIGLAERSARAREMMGMMRLEPFAERRIDQLSGGQKQRVALARALAIQPRALLLDEALTALDAKLRDTLRTEIDVLLRRLGITTVYVTHDQEEAMSLGDRIIVMDRGKIVQIGSPREIYHRPGCRFVAEFVGTMNRLPGEVRDGQFVTKSGRIPCRHLDPDCREVMFRPESVTIADPAECDLTGRVAATFFLGDRTRLVVDGIGDQPVIVESESAGEFVVDQIVHLKVRSAAVHAF
ncbi:ABC transporter ATP-binding protein [Siculibacillus lacustris]|uniref:ABC transporter ATP-binding protein n=1 Tax=Siculibacillus lacustris TaxID=1549641 RepID=A0A4Q9VTN7_9HYPH|nr:ABC transporter ATP-binding protein [Siculibacillus lacustris]TBW39464.1 ABC transporter ATP-binding protein [Siculibacillus lacustris]